MGNRADSEDWLQVKILICLLVFVAAFAPAVATENNPGLPFDRKLSRKDEDWVRKTLRSLKLDEKIGQMLIADASVIFWNRESSQYKKLQHHIVDNKVGGVILYRLIREDRSGI